MQNYVPPPLEPREPPPPGETFIALPPLPDGQMPVQRRSKPLKMTVGIPPTASDLGSETDVGVADAGGVDVMQRDNWSLNIRGYIRAPMRVSLGPRDDTSAIAPSGLELHSPPRMVGFSSSNWSYIAIAPNSSASVRVTATNPRVSGTLILTSSVFPDVGYQDVDSSGGMAQGYLNLKFPDLFGTRGGLVVTIGSFSNSYGTAGRRQTNAGFYGTYLFGRIHQTGANVTASIDLNDSMELILEAGFGAKLELLPFLGTNLHKQMYLPGDPRVDLGSNFVQHAHAGLRVDDWLMIGAHYLSSWTPNDHSGQSLLEIKGGRLSSTGIDVHVDHERWGSGYIGFSHVWGHDLMSLDNGLQVIHAGRGYDFKLQYFGNKFRQYMGSGAFLPNDGGRVETVLFQWTLRSYEVFQQAARQSVNLNMFAMFSHAYSVHGGQVDLRQAGGPLLQGPFTIDDNKLKYGALVEFAAFRNLSINGRFDRVEPTASDKDQNYTALTGQLVIRSDWRSSRQIILGYTRFFLGAHDYPDSPYSASYKQADPNLFVLSAIMSL